MQFTNGHALLIGVGTYQHASHMDVSITTRDAQEVATVLRDPTLCGYPESQVTLLHDASATRQNIIAALDQLATSTSPDDTVLLFYAGHGDYGDDGVYYLTGHDTRWSNRKVIAGSGISQHELLAKMQALQARRVLLIFNACHAGELSPTLGPADQYTGQSLPQQTMAALLSTGEGRVIITACREDQVSFIGSGSLTIFTQALVNGLRGQGTSSQWGYISAYDLYTHLYFTVLEEVERLVNEATRAKYGGPPQPELTVLKGIGPFAVSLYRGETTLGEFAAPPRPADGTAFREVRPDYSRAMLQQLQVQVGGDVHMVAGDQIHAQGAQGFLNRPSGPVSQVFGEQRTVNTGGGDYAERDIDKRQGAFVSGGTVYGPVTGINMGSVSSASSVAPGHRPAPLSLHEAPDRVRQAIEQARQRGESDLAYDLEDVVRDLEAAQRAEQEQKHQRRQQKLQAAQQTLRTFAADHAWLNQVAQIIETIS